MNPLKVIKPKGAKYCRTSKYNIHSRTWLFTFYNSKMKIVFTRRMKLHTNISKSITRLCPMDYHMLKRAYKNKKQTGKTKNKRKKVDAYMYKVKLQKR